MGLEHIFDVELRFRPDMRPVVRPEGREGELVGSGDGTVQGPEIRGTIRWSNFETPGERLCGMYPAGMIETDDGGSLRFDARGFALRRDGAGTSARWKVAGAMRLETDDPRYAWISDGLTLWEGEFDGEVGRAAWRVYRSRPR
jgi:hypothetical protein